ncbi:MAG: cache domain-containing protein [Leptospiraceae bacterium]|nr:cache domain-containing protein [Leptospiraceae bacterium]MCP5497924.1 cache domain-containing protein [Leptospiraceae bacterium]
MNVKHKLLLTNGIFLLIVLLSGSILYYLIKNVVQDNLNSELENITNGSVQTVKTAINSSVKNHLKTIADKSKSVAQYYYEQYKNGKISKEVAYNQVKNIFLDSNYMKIGTTGYLAGVSGNGVIVIHPKAEGKDVSKAPFMQKAMDIAKSLKEGTPRDTYLDYLWKNPGEEKERLKAAGLDYFEPWDLIVWASSYKEEFNSLVNPEDFKQEILSLKIRQSGYVYLMDSEGNLIIHPQLGTSNVYDSQDSNGNYFIREIIKNKNGKIFYDWKNPNEQKRREKIAYYKYIPEIDWIVVTTAYIEEVNESLYLIRNIIIFTVLLTSLIMVGISLKVSQFISKPINNLMLSINEMKSGNLAVTAKVETKDEIGVLAENFNQMSHKLKESFEQIQAQNLTIREYNENLERKVQERTLELNKANEELLQKNEEMTRDLNMARRIQLSIIPSEKDYPQMKELSLGSQYNSMDSVGGDIYDIIPINDHTYGFLMADVSGHGVPAALITAMVKVSFNSNSIQGLTTGEICSRVNKEIFKLIGDLDYYLTAYYGILDFKTGEFTYTNAGHHAAILYRKKTKQIEHLDTVGFMIGILEESNYETLSVKLEPGDKILLLTDGIPEARNRQKEFYEYDRLIEYTTRYMHLNPKEFVDGLIADVDSFCEGNPANDDRAVLCIEFLYPIDSKQKVEESIRIEARQLPGNEKGKEAEEIKIMQTKALNFLKKNSYMEALELLLDLNQKDSKNSIVKNSLGIAYYRMGKLEDAHKVLKEGVELNQNNKNLQRNLALIESRLKKQK